MSMSKKREHYCNSVCKSKCMLHGAYYDGGTEVTTTTPLLTAY